MIQLILALLVILWLLGFVHIPFLSNALFSISNHPFSLHSILLLILIVFVINFLPGIFRTIAIVLFIFWLLSLFGVFVFGGLGQIILIILILAVLFSIF